MTEKEINVILDAAESGICVTYLCDEDENIVFRDAKDHPRRNLVVGAALTVVAASLPARALGSAVDPSEAARFEESFENPGCGESECREKDSTSRKVNEFPREQRSHRRWTGKLVLRSSSEFDSSDPL
jgi:hypothetical protein